MWGAGVLSVMGISFASVPLFTSVIGDEMVGGRAAEAAGGSKDWCWVVMCMWQQHPVVQLPKCECRQLSVQTLPVQIPCPPTLTPVLSHLCCPPTHLPVSVSPCLPQAKGVPFNVIFGQLIGTTALCALWPFFLSFLPYKALRKLFPPIVTGGCGCGLCSSGRAEGWKCATNGIAARSYSGTGVCLTCQAVKT